MVTEIPITRARKEMFELSRRLTENPDIVAVTRRGKPVLAILPWELYESIVETLEIMSGKKLMAAFLKGIRDIQEGRTFSSEEVKKELGL